MKAIIYIISSIITLNLVYNVNDTIISCTNDNVFTGAVDNNWDNVANWSAGCVPGNGTITGKITIASDCIVSASNSNNYSFGTSGRLVLEEGVLFTNNGTGTWDLSEIIGLGTYTGDLNLDKLVSPGGNCFLCADYSCGTPLSAFEEFNTDAVTISFDNDEVTIESNGLPNHTSPYWQESNSLHIEQTYGDHTTPGFIRERSYTLVASLCPKVATNSSATGLGAIGISVYGPPIFNDEEGPNRPFDEPTATGLDYAGAHNGPSGYHYHLEAADVPENTTLSHDDEKLVGIMADGFLLYGRKEMGGTYPTDLDESGGHYGTTPHSNGEEMYHYHIKNEFYIGSYVMLFGGDLQGTPNSIL